MTNSMKDLLLGLGFKPAPKQVVPVPPARDAQKRPVQPVPRHERNDASRNPPSRRDHHPRAHEKRPGPLAQDKRDAQGARPEHDAYRPRHAPQPITPEQSG